MSKKVIPNFLPISLADAILKERISAALTIRGAAKIAQVDASALHRMEIGEETPSLNNYYRVCKWLDEPLDAFFLKPKKVKK